MIIIIDNGSQYTHLIKRNCRDLGYEAEIFYAKAPYELFEEQMRVGISRLILSGGPKSVYEEEPNLGTLICEKIKNDEIRLPLLGVCYGHQMIGHVWGGKVAKGKSAEYGVGEIEVDEEDALFAGLPKKFRAWVSHYDEVKKLPKEFVRLAHSETCDIEAMRHLELPIFSTQFHPEVWHTEHGEEMLKNFLEVNAKGL
ncbi:glutamine-hydrolyzing GMP synthase [Candidatus Micrarchaeota archaeon]|nr:glutamine-hydrolyzing GMP synthase [Candidatus Micrarchaeota archaeon]